MIKNLLAFVMAVCMMMETSVMSYAAVVQISSETESASDEEILASKEDVVAMESINTMEEDIVAMESGSAEEEDIIVSETEDVQEENLVLLETEEATGYLLKKQTDGSYQAETDTFVFSILPEAGYEHIRIFAAIEAKGESILEKSYRLETYYQEKGKEEVSKEIKVLLETKSYQETYIKRLESDSEYDIYFILKNTSGEELARFNGDFVLRTKETDEPLIINEMNIQETSLTLEVELFCPGGIYYAPTDGSVEEKKASLTGLWGKINIRDLEAGTEYYLQYRNDKMQVLYETVFTTKAIEAKIDYDISATVNDYYETEINIRVDVSEYKGEAKRAVLNCVYYNEFGRRLNHVQNLYLTDVQADGNKGKSFVMKETFKAASLTHMVSLDTYDFTVWVDFDNVSTKEEYLSVSAPKMEEVNATIALSQHPTVPSITEVIISVDKYPVTVTLFYRPKESHNVMYTCIPFRCQQQVTEQLISGYFEPGVEYELQVYVGGKLQESKLRLGTADITLKKIGEGETNAFDVVRDFKIESTQELEQEYSLILWYCKEEDHNGYTTTSTDRVVFNAENGYQTCYKSAEKRIYGLEADTDYYLRWSLRDSNNKVVYEGWEKIRTKSVDGDVQLKNTENLFYKQKFNVSMVNRENRKNFGDYAYNNLAAFWRKKGESQAYNTYGFRLDSMNGYSNDIEIKNLQEKTTYELYVKDKEGNQYAQIEFTTPEDPRTLEVTGIEEKVNYVNLHYDITGAENWSGYVQCYVREKGSDDAWERAVVVKYPANNNNIITLKEYNNEALKDNVTYEYQMGFHSVENGKPIELEKVVRGEFSKQQRDYTLDFNIDNDDITGNRATLSVVASGKPIDEEFNVELTLSDGQKKKATLKKSEDYKATVTFENLSEDTEYTITKAVLSVIEEEDVAKEIIFAEQEYDFSFKTKVVYSIQLSQDRLLLNVAHSDENGEESFGRLVANITPQTDEKQVDWFSSDETVATVSEDGTVTACGVGRATITAVLSDNEKVKATCEVIAKDYVAGYVDEEGNILELNAYTTPLIMYLNDSRDNIALYERAEDGKLTEVTDYTVSIENGETLLWENGRFTANGVGETKVIFEKDGFRESVLIQVEEVVYALANTDKIIGNVKFPQTWGNGWLWKYPDTPLVTNGVDFDNKYPFEAVYIGEEMESYETTLMVYMANITGVKVEELSDSHKGVLEVGEKDSISLMVTPIYQGTLSKELYSTNISLPKNKKGLIIIQNPDGTYKITAQKKGVYNLKVEIKAKDRVIAKTTYKIKAEEVNQINSIRLISETEGIIIENNKIIMDSSQKAMSLNLKAVVTDRNGVETQTALQWKSSDKSLVTVKPISKKDTHNAQVEIKAKAQGNAIITVSAKDATGYQTQLNLEIQNYAPRVNRNKVWVNLAYNYTVESGKSLAYKQGTVEIVPVYGESIQSIELLKMGEHTTKDELGLEHLEGDIYLIKPLSEELDAGEYSYVLSVKTDRGENYNYELNVIVEDVKPKLTYVNTQGINLFYTNSTGKIEFKLDDNLVVEEVNWKDLDEGTENGFSISSGYTYKDGKYKSHATIAQQNIKMENGELQEAGVASGTLTVKLKGYKEQYIFENVKLKYTHKKPLIITNNATTKVAGFIGQKENYFTLYNKTEKKEVQYSTQKPVGTGAYFDEIQCDVQDVVLSCEENSSKVQYNYNLTEKKQEIGLKLKSPVWREDLHVKHTIVDNSPKALLSAKQLTLNTNAKSMIELQVLLKDMPALECLEMEIKGTNSKSQKLLDRGLLEISSDGNRILVEQIQENIAGESIAKGIYNYQIIPYYKGVENKVELNKLNLKIKVVDKPVKVSIKPKGSLDLARGMEYSLAEKTNVVIANPKFSNWSEGYRITDYKLVGQYSNYFKLNYDEKEDNYYITIKNIGKLRAKQPYKLAVNYTVVTEKGEIFKVTSSDFTVKPKQTKPKVVVKNNNQTLYVAADNIVRYVDLSLQAYYEIENAYGSVDCNKDGKADIVVSGNERLTVKLADKNAIPSSVKGKTYSIPVYMHIVGRDGVVKDTKVTIKISVKN